MHGSLLVWDLSVMDGFLGIPVALVTAHPVPVLTVAAALLAVVAYYASRPRNLPPGPWGYPFFGSAHLFGNDVHWDFAKLGKKYGEIFTLMMGTRPMIILNSHRLIKEAFVKRGEDFANRPQMYALDFSGLTDELFNHHYTPEWKVHKKFEMRILRNHGFGSVTIEPTFQQNLDQMYVYFDSLKNEPVNMTLPLSRLTASTIAAVVYGGHLTYNDPELDYIIKLVNDFVDTLFRVGMRWAYWADNVHHLITRLLFPRMMLEARTTTHTFQKFLLEKVNEHRETLDPDHPRDVIDGYLSERGDDPALTDVVFASTLLMMIPDAIDTTQNLFNFMILYLAHNQEWQKEVQDQIDHACGQRRPSLKERSSNSLPKVEATMMEVARLSNIVCLSIAHSPVRDTTLDGYFIPEDSYILANIYAAHMEEEIFPQATKFVPQRHLDKDGNFIRNDVTIPFSSGRRMCIGEQMVKNEAFLFISNTLQRYTFKFPEGEPWPPIADQGGLIRSPVPYKVCAIPR